MDCRWFLHHISWLIVLWMSSESTHPKAAQKSYDPSRYSKDGSMPQITQSPVDKTIKEGKGVALLCHAIGKPTPRIKWKKNGVTVAQDDRIKIRTTNGASKLRIRNAIGEDSGNYHCVAKNWFGSSKSIEATLVVREKNETRKRGTCKSYTGNICSAFLSKDTKVFVPLLRSENVAEERIRNALTHLRGYIHPSCQTVLTKALCYNLFPPCRTLKPPRPELLCKDECEVLLGRTCSKEIRLLQERLAAAEEDTLPNCLGLSYDEPDRKQAHCLELGQKVNPGRPGRNKCSESADVSPHIMEPVGRSHSLCDGTSGKKAKIYNKEILQLLRNVKKEIQSGRMSLTVHSSELSTYCFTAAIPLTDLVRDWNGFHKTQRIPNIRWPRNFTVPGLRITTTNSSVDSILVPIGSASCYRPHEKITLQDVAFYYRYDTRSKLGSFLAKGNYNLCKTVFNVTMETLSDGTLKLSGSSNTPLDLSTIETVFLTARPSEMIVKIIKDTNLFVARLMNPRMEAYIGKELLVKFSGESYFGVNASPVSLEFYSGKIHEDDVLLVGISSRHFSINQALKMFTEIDLPYLNFTKYSSSESSVGVTLSTESLDLTRYPVHRFKQQPLAMAFAGSVPKGLSLASRSAIPTKCKGSHVCELLQVIFGSGSEFTLKVSIDWNEIQLGWHFENLSKTAVIPFDRAEMTIKILDWSLKGRVYRSGERSKGLLFSGNMAYDGQKPNITAKFGTRIVLTRALGMELFTLKNVQLGLLLSTNQSKKSTIRGEADLELGSGCMAGGTLVKPKCLTGHVYMGFSDATADHYFYGTLSPVSLARLLEAYGIGRKLPTALASIGFPEGLQISVAREAYDLRHVGGPSLRPGFILTGKMSVLGIETSVAISLLPKDFLIDAEIRWDKAAGKIDDLASLSGFDKNHGRQLYIKARVYPEPFVKAHMNGYARLFGIFDEVRMLITRETLLIRLKTDKRKSLQISVHIDTNYSSHRNDTHFTATIAFGNGLSKLTRLASKQVVQMLEAKMTELKLAKGDVQRRRKACNKTVKRECSSCIHNKSCADFLTRCRSEREPSPLSEVCQLLVLDRCLATQGACRNACVLIRSKANETCASFEAAAKSQRELERGVRRAEQFRDSDLFHIHAISFEADITSESFDEIHLDTSLECTIFGQKQKLDGLRMQFNEFVAFSSEIAKYALEWYRKERSQHKTKQRHPDNMPRSSSPS